MFAFFTCVYTRIYKLKLFHLLVDLGKLNFSEYISRYMSPRL
jgi:hypothetical protein